MQIPSRIRFPLVEPRPKSDDPETSLQWKKKRVKKAAYEDAITGWRRQRMANIDKGENNNGKNSGSVK